VSPRPLVFVSGLTIGDYLLWNWSLGSNHDVLALVSGLTLPPLVIASLWLLALNVARVIARSTRGRALRGGALPRAGRGGREGRQGTATADPGEEEAATSAASAGRSSSKLAA